MNILIFEYTGDLHNSLEILSINNALNYGGHTGYVVVNSSNIKSYKSSICKKINYVTYSELNEFSGKATIIDSNQKEVNIDFAIIGLGMSNYDNILNLKFKYPHILFIDSYYIKSEIKFDSSIFEFFKDFYKIYCDDIDCCENFNSNYCGIEFEYRYPLIKYINVDTIEKYCLPTDKSHLIKNSYILSYLINEDYQSSVNDMIDKSEMPRITIKDSDSIDNRKIINYIYNSYKVFTDSIDALYLSIILNIPVHWSGENETFHKIVNLILNPVDKDDTKSIIDIIRSKTNIYLKKCMIEKFNDFSINSMNEFCDVLSGQNNKNIFLKTYIKNLKNKESNKSDKSNINILIVHYNTQNITEKTILSINKCMSSKNIRIYLFDNSDESPFTYRQDNLVYIDNTRGQIINFEEWLKQYPNRFENKYVGANCGSAKHCYTVQKFMDMFDDNFILMDSDIILKRDCSEFWDDQYLWIGQTILNYKKTNSSREMNRVLPFICFINSKMCSLYHIKYFNDNFMCRLGKSNDSTNFYDTGSCFYFAGNSNNLPYKQLNISDYISHFRHGSFPKTDYLFSFDSDKWLNQNKLYWGSSDEKIIISMTTYPERLHSSMITWKSILNQSVDRSLYDCCLVLSKEEFPNGLEKECLEFFNENNIEIIWDDGNQKSHKKLMPVLNKYSNRPILCVDDDIYREGGWLQTFIDDHKSNPFDIIFGCAKYQLNMENNKFELIEQPLNSNITYNNIRPANGFGGVLYPAFCFSSQEFYNRDLYMKLSPTSDELWQFYFNIKENRLFRPLSKTFDYLSRQIDGSQETDKILHELNGPEKYQSMWDKITSYF